MKNFNSKGCFLSAIFLIASLPLTLVHSKGRYFEIGDSRKIYMECKGKGSPVVLLLAGYPMRGDFAWNTPMPGGSPLTVYSGVSKFTKVCIYDRPGTLIVKGEDFAMSRSTPVKQPVNVIDQTSDLERLIRAANLPGPYIFVAHSASGLIARMYAFSHSKDLAGLILLDVTTEDLKDKWTRKEWTVFDYSINVLTDEELYKHKEFEWIDFDLSFYLMQKSLGKGKQRIKLKIPHTTVITADKKPKVEQLIKSKLWPSWTNQKLADDVMQKIAKAQDELAQSFEPAAKHIKNPDSSHNIPVEQPQLVIDEIQALVNQSRSKNE
ncbi:MAG: alpha/beta hydrolase [Tatlockia sp.]|nr:alpha/beta hydrolase [Tatlockia sp.]